MNTSKTELKRSNLETYTCISLIISNTDLKPQSPGRLYILHYLTKFWKFIYKMHSFLPEIQLFNHFKFQILHRTLYCNE